MKRLLVTFLFVCSFLQAKETICLNMIVKDESRVIEACLESVKPLIDYWVIVDTGSSDDTIKRIRKTLKDIPGELHERPWKNFGHNREEAKRLAAGKGDYLLFIDADEHVVLENNYTKPHLTKDVYFVYFYDEEQDLAFTRAFLLKNRPDIHWKGAMHEQLTPDTGVQLYSTFLSGVQCYTSTSASARSQDPEKYAKDAAVLKEEIEKDPANPHNYFYLAQSYYSAGSLELSREMYAKRAELGGDNDAEVFWALYGKAKIEELLGYPEESIVSSYTKAFEYKPTRVEPLVQLVNFYIMKGSYEKAYESALKGIRLPLPIELGYIDVAAYTYKMPLLFANASLALGKYQDALPIYERLLSQNTLPIADRTNVELNLAFCREKVRSPLSIGAIFKNEAPYLKEWIEYHKLVGVSHFYLYNNGSTDDFLNVLKPYISNGEVTLIDWPDQHKEQWRDHIWAWVRTTQQSAYEDAIARAKGKSKWLALIDIDEFLVPMKNDSLISTLEKYDSSFPALEVHWRIFGTSNVEKIPSNKLLIEMLTKKSLSNDPLNRNFKTILKPEAFDRFTWPPHQCSYQQGLHPIQIAPEELVINHYSNRTLEYFHTHKIPNKQRMDNTTYSKQELALLLAKGNDIEDEKGNIQRFIPKLREKIHPQKKIIYMYPGMWGDLFALDNPIANRDDCLLPLVEFKKKAEEMGYEIRQTYDLSQLDPFHKLIVFDIPKNQLLSLLQYPKDKLVLYLWEPPSVLPENYFTHNHAPFSQVFTWNDSLVDSKKYFKFSYPVLKNRVEQIPSFQEKKLATLIACNKESRHPNELYSARRSLIAFFKEKPEEVFSLYGRGWPKSTPHYKGALEKKRARLPSYRFCFAYENIKDVPGYITEKIFEAFESGTVPVYLGASNITDYIPKNCFIDAREFSSLDDLYTYLREMNEQTYTRYLSHIQNFLESREAHLFSQERFVAQLLQLLEEAS